jgi:stage III sporulation protein AG
MVYATPPQAAPAGAFGAPARAAEEVPTGVIVVADGAGSLQVRLALTQAVRTLLGLPAASVEVLRRGESLP